MMRRFYTMILAMLATVPAAFAQTIDGVVVENYTMERSGNYIIVDMDLDVSGVDVRNSEVVVLTPHIVRDTLSKDLRSIGIYGRNRHFYYERNEDLAPTSGDDLRFRSIRFCIQKIFQNCSVKKVSILCNNTYIRAQIRKVKILNINTGYFNLARIGIIKSWYHTNNGRFTCA